MDTEDVMYEIKQVRNEIAKLRKNIDDLSYKFYGHSHLEDGEVHRNFKKEEEFRKQVIELLS